MSDLLERDKLVFNQVKLIELNAEFAIRDTDGNATWFALQELLGFENFKNYDVLGLSTVRPTG